MKIENFPEEILVTRNKNQNAHIFLMRLPKAGNKVTIASNFQGEVILDIEFYAWPGY